MASAALSIAAMVVAKTEDGGARWKVIFATTDLNAAYAVFFTDENHRVVRIDGGPIITTDDPSELISTK